MKKRNLWIQIVIFFVLLGILLTPFAYMVRPNDWDYPNYAERYNIGGYYAEERNSLDAVFIGSSTTQTSWIPYDAYQQYGFTSYSFSSNGMPPSLLLPMLKEAKRSQNPQTIVIDVGNISQHELDPSYYTIESIRNTTDMFDNTWNRLWSICYASEKEKLMPGIDTFVDLLTYHGEWRKNIFSTGKRWIDNANENPDKGFLMVTASGWKESSRSGYESITETGNLSEYSQTILNDLLSYCEKDKGTKYIFVIVPRQISSEKEEKCNNAVGAYIQNRNFDFHDFNKNYDEIGIDFKTDFYNTLHLNLKGAMKYTAYVGKFLADRNIIKHKQDDSIDCKWEEGYQSWKNRESKAIKQLEQTIKPS